MFNWIVMSAPSYLWKSSKNNHSVKQRCGHGCSSVVAGRISVSSLLKWHMRQTTRVIVMIVLSYLKNSDHTSEKIVTLFCSLPYFEITPTSKRICLILTRVHLPSVIYSWSYCLWVGSLRFICGFDGSGRRITRLFNLNKELYCVLYHYMYMPFPFGWPMPAVG